MVDAISFDLGFSSPAGLHLVLSDGLAPLAMPDAILRFQAAMEDGDVSRRGTEALRVVVGERFVVEDTGVDGSSQKPMSPVVETSVTETEVSLGVSRMPAPPAGSASPNLPSEAELPRRISPLREVDNPVDNPVSPANDVPSDLSAAQTARTEARRVVVEERSAEDGDVARRGAGVRRVSSLAEQAEEPEVYSSRKGELIERKGENALHAEEGARVSVPLREINNPVNPVNDVPRDLSAAQTARTETIVEAVGKTVEIVNQVVEAVVEEIAVTPTLAQGEGEIRITLKPTVLDGSEIRLTASAGELTVSVVPATAQSAQVVQQNIVNLESALAEHAPSFHHVAVVIATSKKGKVNEAA